MELRIAAPLKEGHLKFVCFSLSTTLRMALNVQKVKEVVEASGLTAMPSSSAPVLGVYDLRGAPVPVIELETALGESTSGAASAASQGLSRRRILICELQGVWVGILVRRVERLLSCAPSDFLPPPTIKGENMTGMIRRGSEFIPVLDLDRIIAKLTGLDWAEEAKSQKPDAAQAYVGKRVLIADDSRAVLLRLVSLFKAMGFEVITASNGREALERFKENEGKIDLVFTDIEMPLLDGIGFVRELKSNPFGARVPVMFNSALSNPALIRDITHEHLGQYLVKFDEELIRKHLELTLAA